MRTIEFLRLAVFNGAFLFAYSLNKTLFEFLYLLLCEKCR